MGLYGERLINRWSRLLCQGLITTASTAQIKLGRTYGKPRIWSSDGLFADCWSCVVLFGSCYRRNSSIVDGELADWAIIVRSAFEMAQAELARTYLVDASTTGRLEYSAAQRPWWT